MLKVFIFLPFPYRDTVGESGKSIRGKVSIYPYNFCLSCVLLFCLTQAFRISSQLLSFFNEVCFWALLIQSSTYIVKMKVFLNKFRIFGLIDQTYKSVEDCMSNHNVIVKKKRNSVNLINLEPFPQNLFSSNFIKL